MSAAVRVRGKVYTKACDSGIRQTSSLLDLMSISSSFVLEARPLIFHVSIRKEVILQVER